MKQAGQSLLEVILALALLAVLGTGVLTISFRYLSAQQRAIDLQQASFILQESVEAMSLIAQSNYASLTDGTHGLVKSGGTWALQDSADVTDGRYLRTIHVASVNRDEDCLITHVAGTPDPDTKEVTFRLDWDIDERPLSQSVTTYVTNWANPTSQCAITQAGNISIDISLAHLDSTKKQIEGITIENLGANDVTIDKVTILWQETGTALTIGELESVKIGGTDVWHKNGNVGSPAGGQPSGVQLDIEDVTITSGTTVDWDRIRFDTKLDGYEFTITATMADDSSTTVMTDGFLP